MGSAQRAGRDVRRLYGDLAWTWPIMSPPEDYVPEAMTGKALLEEASRIPVGSLLNLGCGGGHLDWTLKRYFDVTGIDISREMLRLARRLNPDVSYRRGDMRSARLGRRFDAVAVFDSIEYMHTEADLRRTFRTAWVHLRPGGAFLTYAEFTPRRLRGLSTSTWTNARGGVEIAFREDVTDPDPRDTTFEVRHVHAIRRGGRTTREEDRHVLGVFPLRTWTRLLREQGYRVGIHRERASPNEDPFPWFVCRRPG